MTTFSGGGYSHPTPLGGSSVMERFSENIETEEVEIRIAGERGRGDGINSPTMVVYRSTHGAHTTRRSQTFP